MEEMQMETKPANNPYMAPDADMAEATANESVLAGLERRLGAAIIDGIITGLLVLLPIVLFFGGWQKYALAMASAGIFGTAISIVLAAIVYILVNGKFLKENGQTIGKKLLKIKIVRSNGAPADFKRILFYRYLPAQLILLIPVLGNFLSLINVLFVFRASRQCVHDQIADTIVVKA